MHRLNIYRTLLLLLTLVCGSPVWAQELGKELLLNGGLEKYYRKAPLEGEEPMEEYMPRAVYAHHWRADDQLAPTKVRGGHSGDYALLIYLNGGSITYHDNDYSTLGYVAKHNIIPIEAGSEYECTFWYKGDYSFRAKVCVVIEWYKGDQIIKRDNSYNKWAYYVPKVGAEWQQHKVAGIKAPAGVDRAAFSFKIDDSTQKKFYIDDISFKQVKRGVKEPTLDPPANVRATAMQHEVMLTWRAIAEPEATYEIYCNDTKVGSTTATTFVHKHLKPDTPYTYAIKAVKGDETSALTKAIKVSTKDYNRSLDDPTRVPHLYTITKEGEAPQELSLFYTDLYEEGAVIEYYLDGAKVTPVEDTLTLQPGKHTLRVMITEVGAEPLELVYYITVK